MKLLLVEDEPRAAELLSKGLREQGYAVDVSPSGRDALYRASITDYDAIVLDVMLPGVDGFEVCRRIRGGGAHTPILMLTARDAVESRIERPRQRCRRLPDQAFDFGELLARLRAVIRRGRLPVTPAVITFGKLRVDLRARQAYRQDSLLRLTVARVLAARVPGAARRTGGRAGRHRRARVGCAVRIMSNVIDVMVQRLRRKIDDPDGASLIMTRRGEGYMFSDTERMAER